jgi:hypothetical protein
VVLGVDDILFFLSFAVHSVGVSFCLVRILMHIDDLRDTPEKRPGSWYIRIETDNPIGRY